MIASSFSHSTLSRFVSTVTDPSIGAKFFKAWASNARLVIISPAAVKISARFRIDKPSLSFGSHEVKPHDPCANIVITAISKSVWA